MTRCSIRVTYKIFNSRILPSMDFIIKEILICFACTITLCYLKYVFVQAALAPVALDMARMMGTDVDKDSASRLLTIAVISILVTAPIGAFGIQWFGPKLLSKSGR